MHEFIATIVAGKNKIRLHTHEHAVHTTVQLIYGGCEDRDNTHENARSATRLEDALCSISLLVDRWANVLKQDLNDLKLQFVEIS